MQHLTPDQIEDVLVARSPSGVPCKCPTCQRRLDEAKAIRQRLRQAFVSIRPSRELREAVLHLVRVAGRPPVGDTPAWQPESRYSVKAQVEIEAGVCGFRTQAAAESDDSQHVTFAVDTDCEKIGQLAAALGDRQPLDAYQEISPAGKGIFMTTVRETLTGCCAGCAVPVGLFKAMQVAAGLALPRDIAIRLAKQES